MGICPPYPSTDSQLRVCDVVSSACLHAPHCLQLACFALHRLQLACAAVQRGVVVRTWLKHKKSPTWQRSPVTFHAACNGGAGDQGHVGDVCEAAAGVHDEHGEATAGRHEHHADEDDEQITRDG